MYKRQGLAHAVSAALNNGAYVDDDAVYRQGVCPQAGHDLPVEQGGDCLLYTSLALSETPICSLIPMPWFYLA